MKRYKRVLTVAGSDSGGGAGIQADLKTMSACGCFGMSAITAITVQNTLGVQAVHAIPCDIIAGQIDAVLSDIGADAVKIGMLNSAETMLCVKESLLRNNAQNIVLDPVMVSTSGHKLMQDDAIDVLKGELLNIARIITPNLPEAEIILGQKIEADQFEECAKELSLGGKVSVLLKAGHLDTDVLTDVFYNAETDETIKLLSKKVLTKNTHGTGCTLSAAVASFLAHGLSLNDAVKKAKEYVSNAIIFGADYSIGHGFGSTHHFHQFWE